MSLEPEPVIVAVVDGARVELPVSALIEVTGTCHATVSSPEPKEP